MDKPKLTPSGKPYDIHERLLLLACDVVKTAQFLHTRGPIARALSYQILSSGTSAGSNAEEGDGASSHRDFIAKTRIALKEAKEVRFRESDELVRILGKIVHTALRRKRTDVNTAAVSGMLALLSLGIGH